MAKQVAQVIIAFCSSCRMDLAHVIEAMDGGRIVRVHCKTCKKQHAYKPPKGFSEPRTHREPPRKPAPKRRAPNQIPVEWREVMEGKKGEHSKPYSLKGLFEEGDLIAHPKFGTGWVKRLIGMNKMEVLFEEEVKILVRGDTAR